MAQFPFEHGDPIIDNILNNYVFKVIDELNKELKNRLYDYLLDEERKKIAIEYIMNHDSLHLYYNQKDSIPIIGDDIRLYRSALEKRLAKDNAEVMIGVDKNGLFTLDARCHLRYKFNREQLSSDSAFALAISHVDQSKLIPAEALSHYKQRLASIKKVSEYMTNNYNDVKAFLTDDRLITEALVVLFGLKFKFKSKHPYNFSRNTLDLITQELGVEQ